MNRAFDYNGTIVSASNSKKQLCTKKKVITVDSADRDRSVYYTNGEFVVYLPRVYENIVSIRLMSGQFPGVFGFGLIHSYSAGPNTPSTDFSGDTAVDANAPPVALSFYIDISGLNKMDETALGGNKSSFTDNTFAKIPIVEVNLSSKVAIVDYNDHSAQENIAVYSPPIGKLDRLHIRTRLHSQQGNRGFIYWTTDQSPISGGNAIYDYTLSFEIEYMDNAFDNFSSFESRISDRA